MGLFYSEDKIYCDNENEANFELGQWYNRNPGAKIRDINIYKENEYYVLSVRYD